MQTIEKESEKLHFDIVVSAPAKITFSFSSNDVFYFMGTD